MAAMKGEQPGRGISRLAAAKSSAWRNIMCNQSLEEISEKESDQSVKLA